MHKYKRVTAMVTALLMLWLLICSPVQFTAQASESTVVFYSYDEAVEYVRDMLVAREENIVFGIAPGVDGNIMDIIDYAKTYYPGCTGSTGDALNAVIGSCSGCLKYYSTVTVAEYTVEYYTTAEQEAELTKAVNEALASLGLEGKSTYEKVKLIHDYICDRVDYDYEHYFSNEDYKLQYTAYAAMCNRTAVCQGYAALFYRMCMDAGIPTRMMRGSADGGPHAWNIVKIGDYYYNVDATWDGQSDITRHDYFLKGDTWFSMSHIKADIYASDEFCSEFPISPDDYIDYNSLPEPLNNKNVQYTFTTPDGNTVSTTASGKPKVLIFFTKDSSDCKWAISSLKEGNYDDVEIICIGSQSSANDSYVANFKAEYGSEGMDFVSYSRDANIAMGNYAYMSGAVYAEYPVIAYIDANNKVQCVTLGAEGTIRAYIDYYCYGKSGDNDGESNAGGSSSENNNAGSGSSDNNNTGESNNGNNNTGENTSGDNNTGDNNTEEVSYVVDGVDYSAVFNADYYYSNYKDVANAFGKDAQTLFNHFINHGINEGRQASEEFSVESYKANNPDLVNVFGNDTRTYYIHYIKYGKAEGRKATGSTESTGQGNTQDNTQNETQNTGFVVDGVDYSAVFNADYYYSHHKDVANAFGKDARGLFNHFISYGINEGRQASEAFDVEAYKANNPDLVSVFGGDTRTYYIHYIRYGKAEGRKATGSTQNNGYVVDGVDYSAVFNADYYYNHHKDVANAIGNNARALFNHFMTYGIYEGRQACEEFNLDVYKANNVDLVNTFGNDTRTYYIHYIKYGKSEGRTSH